MECRQFGIVFQPYRTTSMRRNRMQLSICASRKFDAPIS
jgi:hypothetical protein